MCSFKRLSRFTGDFGQIAGEVERRGTLRSVAEAADPVDFTRRALPAGECRHELGMGAASVIGPGSVAGLAPDVRQIPALVGRPVPETNPKAGDVTAQTGGDPAIGGGQPGIIARMAGSGPPGIRRGMTGAACRAAEKWFPASVRLLAQDQRADRNRNHRMCGTPARKNNGPANQG